MRGRRREVVVWCLWGGRLLLGCVGCRCACACVCACASVCASASASASASVCACVCARACACACACACAYACGLLGVGMEVCKCLGVGLPCFHACGWSSPLANCAAVPFCMTRRGCIPMGCAPPPPRVPIAGGSPQLHVLRPGQRRLKGALARVRRGGRGPWRPGCPAHTRHPRKPRHPRVWFVRGVLGASRRCVCLCVKMEM